MAFSQYEFMIVCSFVMCAEIVQDLEDKCHLGGVL